jgi:hypothetical protein
MSLAIRAIFFLACAYAGSAVAGFQLGDLPDAYQMAGK